MTYVFDNSPLSTLFRNFYRRRFPTLWQHFDELVDDGDIVSTREVLREIEDGPVESLREWAAQNGRKPASIKKVRSNHHGVTHA